MSGVNFDGLELMLIAAFERPTLKDTIQELMEVQPLVVEDEEMCALVQQTIPKMRQLNEQQFKGLELKWYKPDEQNEENREVSSRTKAGTAASPEIFGEWHRRTCQRIRHRAELQHD